MPVEMNLVVREIELTDIELIADYWLLSDADHLVSMGVDLNKLPTRKDLSVMLSAQIAAKLEDKLSYALIWELNDSAIGHCNINHIDVGKRAHMHLHLWDKKHRQKGIGLKLLRQSISIFFERFRLQELICEPYALNPAPNKAISKLGFKLEKSYTTIPGSLNFEQQVNRWILKRADCLPI